jgi:hypothetical protein
LTISTTARLWRPSTAVRITKSGIW